jgi:hypothetical protein
MSRFFPPLAAAALVLLLCAGCDSESQSNQRLAAENRRLRQDYDGASALLTISNITVVVLGGCLAVSLWTLVRRGPQ